MPIVIYGKEHKLDCKCCSCKSQRGEPSWNWKGGITRNRKKYDKKRYEKVERAKRLKSYGLTTDGYNKLFSQQNGVCAICGQPETKKSFGKHIRRLTIDHNHKTGKVRGLLCNGCNVGLGNFLDSVEFLLKAIKYLKGETDGLRDL